MSSNLIDIIGETFGEWTVLSHSKDEKWLCKCSCGKIKEVWKQGLRSGDSKSCGHQRNENSKKLARELGYKNKTHGQSGTVEYRAWLAAKNRCYNSKLKCFKYYGARGITVCDRWKDSFENFFTDLGPRPSSKHSLERRDVNGPYSPDNCYWATKKEQNQNTRRNVYINYEDKLYTVSELCERFNISDKLVYWRISSGWDPLDAISKPADEKVKKRVRNNKNKGRTLQNYIRDSLKNEFPQLGQSDIKSQIMGVSGIDIELSDAALDLFPVSIECKNYTQISFSEIKQAIDQAQKNMYHDSIPIVCFREKNWSFDDTIVGFETGYENAFPNKKYVYKFISFKKKNKFAGSIIFSELNSLPYSFNEYRMIKSEDSKITFMFWKDFLQVVKRKRINYVS